MKAKRFRTKKLVEYSKSSLHPGVRLFSIREQKINIKTAEMKLYRAIQGKNINKESIGCHWTWEKQVAENLYNIVYGGDSEDFDPNAEITIISIDVDADMIDLEATLESICEYPKECEVTLKRNTQIGEYNTGDRVDDWVLEFDRKNIFNFVAHQKKYRNINLYEFHKSLKMISDLFNIEL